jgi:hypothetical protein
MLLISYKKITWTAGVSSNFSGTFYEDDMSAFILWKISQYSMVYTYVLQESGMSGRV